MFCQKTKKVNGKPCWCSWTVAIDEEDDKTTVIASGCDVEGVIPVTPEEAEAVAVSWAGLGITCCGDGCERGALLFQCCCCCEDPCCWDVAGTSGACCATEGVTACCCCWCCWLPMEAGGGREGTVEPGA